MAPIACALSWESCGKTTEEETKCTMLQVRKALESIATVSARISLGAKLAQAEGSVRSCTDLTALHARTLASLPSV